MAARDKRTGPTVNAGSPTKTLAAVANAVIVVPRVPDVAVVAEIDCCINVTDVVAAVVLATEPVHDHSP